MHAAAIRGPALRLLFLCPLLAATTTRQTMAFSSSSPPPVRLAPSRGDGNGGDGICLTPGEFIVFGKGMSDSDRDNGRDRDPILH